MLTGTVCCLHPQTLSQTCSESTSYYPVAEVVHTAESKELSQAANLLSSHMKYLNQGLRSRNGYDRGPRATLRVHRILKYKNIIVSNLEFSTILRFVLIQILIKF